MKTYFFSFAILLAFALNASTAEASCLKASDQALLSSLQRTPLCHEMSTVENAILFYSAAAQVANSCPTEVSVETINGSYVVLSSPEMKDAGVKECVGQILPADPGIPTCALIWCN